MVQQIIVAIDRIIRSTCHAAGPMHARRPSGKNHEPLLERPRRGKNVLLCRPVVLLPEHVSLLLDGQMHEARVDFNGKYRHARLRSASRRTTNSPSAPVTMQYVLITIFTCILAAILKIFVAPEHVNSAKEAAGVVLWNTQSGAQQHLYFAVSDCAVRATNILNTTAPTADGASPINMDSQKAMLKPDGTIVTRDDIIVECVGNYFVFRVSFALTLFYVFLTFTTAALTAAHNGCWAFKFGVYGIGFVVTFFIGNPMFYVFAGFARAFSILFILLQIFILVDFAFEWWENFMKRMKSAEDTPLPFLCCHVTTKGFKCLFVTACLGLFLSGFIGSILLYAFYSGGKNSVTGEDESCGLNILFTTITLLLGILAIVSGVVDLQGAPSIGLLVPNVVFAYCVYITWTAAINNPEQGCNPTAGSFGTDGGMIFFGTCVTAFSLAWASVRTAWATRDLVVSTSAAEVTLEDLEEATENENDSKEGKRKKRQQERERKKKEREQERERKKSERGGGSDNEIQQVETGGEKTREDEVMSDEDKEDEDRYHWLFHLIMAFGAVYLSMLLSDWGNGTGWDRKENNATAYTAMWVNAVGSWCAYLLYAWIRFAPLCCPGRDFNVEREKF